ncbi:MAG: glycosyltransferase, partial [Acidimicrobiales bacterium]|nr:glycosyltransferase [Acidimicrobiales bacterium]
EAVRFAGFLDAEAKLREFENHDIYLHTNDVDNTPVSVLEAAAAGLVVVGTNVGGMPFLLESEESALLVEPRNPEKMAAAVLRVFDEPELGEKLSGGGHMVAEESAWPSTRQKWISQIDAVVSPSDERARIEQVYGDYHASGRDQQRWDNEAAGNRCIIAERQESISSLLSARSAPKRVLEIGCGGGTVIGQLREVLDDDTEIFGVDLLADRLANALQLGPVAQADGRKLPFRSDEFDLVVVFTVFSSILDQTIRTELAREIERVLATSGAILWYDMRYLSPNRSVQPLGRKAIQQLFPTSSVQASSLTVLPPLARRLGESDRRTYPMLSRMPFLRSHLLATVVPSSSSTEGPS